MAKVGPGRRSPVWARRRLLEAVSALGGLVVGADRVEAAAPPGSGAVPAEPGDKPAMSLRSEDFGLRGDGIRDESIALIRLRDHLCRDRSKHYRVTFRPGTYRYTNNRWLMGVGSVTLEAVGCTFVNVSDDPAGRNSRPLNTGSLFDDRGDRPWQGDFGFYQGMPIRTAAAGDREIWPTDLAGLVSGARILVHSFDQQWGGFPPNLRFFEYRRVMAVDPRRGSIVLYRVLEHDHDASTRDGCFYDGSLCCGRARVLCLERPNYYYPELVEFLGAVFARNPNQATNDSNGLIIAADTLRLRDCRHNGFLWPSENRIAAYENCRVDLAEIDKLCDRVEFRDCTFEGSIIAATGVNDLLVKGCEVRGGFIGVSPRRASLVGNRIFTGADDPWGAIRNYFNHWPTTLLESLDNEIVHDGALIWAINAGPPYEFAVNGSGSGNEILLDDTAEVRNTVIRQLAPGSRIQLKGSNVIASVARIVWADGQWTLAGDWTTRIIPGQVWEFCAVQSVRESGTRFVGGDKPLIRPLHPTQTLSG